MFNETDGVDDKPVEAAVPEQSVVSPQSHGIIPLRRNRQEGTAGVSTIAEWLASLGLSEYAQRFAENGIDLDVLQHLTDQDLKDIGVVLGHRRKMLAAIARVAGAVASPAAPPPEPKPQDTAERRQITVLFSDLVGSTALSARMDPEDLREVISAYQKCVAETVRHFDGFVAKYLGDGALVYFGYPQAHEDDAERAVRAGLDLIAAVSALKSSDPLKTRVGVATGLVVVGDLIVSGEARERGIVGETPNLAARLQGIADPNMVVIADSTRRLLGNLFELQDLGPRELKGMSGSTRAWAALRPSSVASRFEALRGVGLTQLVGRDEEIELLLRRWSRAKRGEGQVVLISGEPGIGKSRLTAALMERLAGEPHIPLRYFCSPQHTDSALYPTIVQFESAAGFARGDDGEAKRAKLRELLHGADADEFELIAELLSLPNTSADLNLSPQRKRERLFEGVLNEMEALPRQRPVLAMFEDSHWIDPTSREMLDLMVDRVRRMPVLLIVTFRPEFQQSWVGRPHVTLLALNRLDDRHVAALVLGLAGNAPLGSEVVVEIAERTDGVPLFVEELTKAVLERADQERRVAAVLTAGPLPALAVPATLHASLNARLDRIGPAAREVAQICSVLGREFTYELIERLAARLRSDLDSALAQLTQAGLLLCRGVPPESAYSFKHALVQDAAYGTLLRARRQDLHARVAAVLEQHFADLVEHQPELLAHHLTAAGDTERAVDRWLHAGNHAAARLTPLEAIRHFERGLGVLSALPEGPAREGREIELQLARGLSLFTAKGFGAIEAPEAYARARELAKRRGDPRQQFMAVYGLWQSANGAGKIHECRRLSDQLLQLTAGEADDGLHLQAHHSAWATSTFAGDPATAREHSEAGRRLYDPERHRSHRLLYGGHDPGVCACSLGALGQWSLGYPEKALALSIEAIALAERIAHPFSLGIALLFDGMLRLDCGEPVLALQRLEAAEALASEQRLGFAWPPQFLRGAALSAQGAFEESIACLRAALASGVRNFRPYGLACLAAAMALKGEHGASVAAARDGLKEQDDTGYGWWDAELHRLEGVALINLNRIDEGQRALEAALHVAQKQQAKAYELRAATSMARLWRDQGKRQQAHDLLAPVEAWCTEGFDTLDLKQAKELLNELA
jgi:class 3 adenylate cyclase/tetratricopeptide (TPR) repeat protein